MGSAFLGVFKHRVKTGPQKREEGQLFRVSEGLWEPDLNWAWGWERLWPGGGEKAKSNEQLRPGVGCDGKGALNPGGRRAEDGCLGTLRGETSHSSPPWTVARPFPTPDPGPKGRICKEPTSKGPRKLEQAPEEAAQPLAQLRGQGKPCYYGGLPPTLPPLQMWAPTFKFPFPNLKSPHQGSGAQEHVCSAKFTPKPSPEQLPFKSALQLLLGKMFL